MNCRDAKKLIALWVGQDLDDPSRAEGLRQHMSECGACRVRYRRLKHSQAALEQSEGTSTYEVRDSLWPEVSVRLSAPRTRKPVSSQWLPVASFVAACALLIAVLQIDPPGAAHLNGGGTGSAGVARGVGGMSGLEALSHQANSHALAAERPQPEKQTKSER